MFRKQPKPRSFDYRPRYFDPDRDQIAQARKSGTEPEEASGVEHIRSRISGFYRGYRGDTGSPKGVGGQIWQSNMRLILILGIIIAILYIMLNRWAGVLAVFLEN